MTDININSPEIWQATLPVLKANGHKYDRGHALIYAAPKLTGATRMASEACLRIGTGLVTVSASKRGDIYRTTLLPDIMVTDTSPPQNTSIQAVLAGPGGTTEREKERLLMNEFGCARIFDADALPQEQHFDRLDTRSILTPHAGEFTRIFPDITLSHRRKAAIESAKVTGAIIVLKGAETIIASPDGRVVHNDHASPYLAKAGTGDVLAGMITGFAAQGMPEFEACCAAVWIHGEIGKKLGRSLIASEMPREIPLVLSQISLMGLSS